MPSRVGLCRFTGMACKCATGSTSTIIAARSSPRSSAGGPVRFTTSPAAVLCPTSRWSAEMPFEEGLRHTIDWYRTNPEWVAHVKSGEYQHYYERNYGGRAV